MMVMCVITLLNAFMCLSTVSHKDGALFGKASSKGSLGAKGEGEITGSRAVPTAGVGVAADGDARRMCFFFFLGMLITYLHVCVCV